MEVVGLPGSTLFSVSVVATLEDCKSNEQNDCVARSKAETVSTQCGHQCADGTCVSKAVKCNWNTECPDGSDEWNCTCTGFNCTSTGFCLPAGQRCDGATQCSDMSDEQGCPGCADDQFRCNRTGRCIDGKKLCDKRIDCWDGSDETEECPYRWLACWPEGYKCHDGQCIPAERRCDKRDDCSQGEDEQGCDIHCGLDEFVCKVAWMIPTAISSL